MLCRLCAVLLVFFLVPGTGLASNRADVNGDGSVDAEDLSVLGNILAGNIDATGYDMASVVVVAKQGGDFDDPADAADWVASQSPANSNRFVILVMPGFYALTDPVNLPSYTSLVGTDRRNCTLSIEREGVFSGAVVISNSVYVTIRNLQLSNSTFTMSSSAYTNVAYMVDSNYVAFEGVTLTSVTGGGTLHGIVSNWDGDYVNDLRVEDCIIDLTSMNLSSSRRVEGIKNEGSAVTVRNTTIDVVQSAASQHAMGISQDANPMGLNPITKAYGCEISADAKTVGYDFSFYSYSSTVDTCRFYHCVLVGDLDSADIVAAGCYDDLGNPR